MLSIEHMESGLRFVGEIDLSVESRLSEALAEVSTRTGAVHVDLTRLTFLDCTGVRLLLSLADRLGRGRLTLRIDPGGEVDRILRLLQIEPEVRVDRVRKGTAKAG